MCETHRMLQPPLHSLPTLVLGSSSPYRRALLARLGLSFSSHAPEIDESPLPSEAPLPLSIRLARQKALAVYEHHQDAVCIGADQVAVCEGRVMAKPGGREAALEQIHWQMGRTTLFHSAVCLAGPGGQPETPRLVEGVVTTEVIWRRQEEVRPEAIEAMLDADQPYDCAGAAKSEAGGIILLEAMNCPDPTALVGLPLIWLSDALQTWGLGPLQSGGAGHGLEEPRADRQPKPLSERLGK